MSTMIETLKLYLQYPFVRYALIVGVLIALCSSLLGVTLVLKLSLIHISQVTRYVISDGDYWQSFDYDTIMKASDYLALRAMLGYPRCV